MFLNFDDEFCKRKKCAWASLAAFKPIWHSDVTMDLKRRSLVDPIFTYAAHTWPMSTSCANMLDAAYGRMLRYALGLPFASSNNIVHTEELYADLPFVSSVIAERRFKFCAHVFRAQFEHKQYHALADVLNFDTSEMVKRQHTGNTMTYVNTLLRDARFSFLQQLHTVWKDRASTIKFSKEIRAERQSKKYASIYASRIASLLRYFDYTHDRVPEHVHRVPTVRVMVNEVTPRPYKLSADTV